MNEALLQMQVFYEIAMSIGNSLKLKEMLQESLSSYLRKLNCSAGAVLTLLKDKDDRNDYTLNYTIPRDLNRNRMCMSSLEQIPAQMTDSQLADFQNSLPIQGENNKKYYHIMELPNFGLLLMVKSGDNLKKEILRSLKNLNEKLARAGIACIKNQEVNGYNRQLKEEMQHRKQMEEQLLQARKMEAIGTLAGGVAHDFNNLLSIILGNLSLAMIDVEPGKTYSPRLDDVEDATMRARDLANKFITFSSGGQPFLKPFTAKDLLDELKETEFASRSLDLRIFYPDKMWRINVDKIQMKQVLGNIIENAIEAQPECHVKTVDITVRNVSLTGTASEHNVPRGSYVSISIKDKGVGIAEDQLLKIFDPYYSTKRMGSIKGTGLGLSIAHSIVQKHGGYIIPLSHPDEGTTLTIYLPAPAVQAEAPGVRVEENSSVQADGNSKPESKRKERIEEIKKKKKRILIMDDEPMMLDMLSKMATLLGYKVTPAKDGHEAVQIYSQSLDSEQPIDAVILDLTIKGGMDGQQGLKQLLRLNPELVAVASSGQTDNPMIQSYSQFGFKGALEKPFSMGKLREVLKTVLS